MNTKLLYRAFAGLAFLVTLLTYGLTVQPSVPFWDCGEFTAATVQQQVPHPPGAPLFLIVGKLFHMFIPFGDPGWRVNLVSVFATAFSVLLLYFITVKVINNMRGKKVETYEEAIAVFGSSMVAALAFCFSDTLWFNGVESEVYASSTLFVSIIVYLMMRWHEEAETPGNERYLLLIAYLMGLSTGMHLLSLLTMFSIVLLIYYHKYEYSTRGIIIAAVVSVVVFFGLYPGIVKWFPALLGGSLPFKNDAREYIIEKQPIITILTVLGILGAGYGLWAGVKKHRSVLALLCASFLLMVLGYSTYTHTIIRANANTPMNEDQPTNLTKLVYYLGREQYGDAPMWPRRYRGDDDMFIRRYKEYGEWFPPAAKTVERKDGTALRVPEFNQVNSSGELKYLWGYQIEQMYIRYFLWNFVGRASDAQDAPAALFNKKDSDRLNRDSGYKQLFPIRFYALPLIFGLIGLFYHFKRDPRMALVYVLMFLAMGVIAAIYQNQQDPQPRERDYFYVGSFMVFCLWIGTGVYALMEMIYKERLSKGRGEGTSGGTVGIVLASLILVPLNMAVGGWKMHDRSGNYLPFDYAYNILQSVDKDAIVFTNGDNDTFPVWYLQDVAGVRRDVRVVNLSLGNSLWYIDQLKNQSPWGAKKLPLSFSDESLQVEDEYDPKALAVDYGEAKEISIPVAPEIMRKYTNDPAVLADGKMHFMWTGQPAGNRDNKQIYAFRVQDQLVLDILKQTKFERPVYYSMSVGSDAFSGLEEHFRMEGMAVRICPIPVSRGKGNYSFSVMPEKMDKTALNVIGGNEFFTDVHPGFKLRNLSNMNVYFDEVHRRLMLNYRNIYMNYADYLIEEGGDAKKAAAVLDTMNKYISPEQFPMPFQLEYQVGDLYNRAGVKAQAMKYARMAAASSEELISHPEDPYSKYGPYYASKSYELLGEYDKAAAKLRMLEGASSDPNIQAQIEQLTVSKYEAKGDYVNAIKSAEALVQKYQNSNNPSIRSMVFITLPSKIAELRQKAGLPAVVRDTAGSTPTH